MNEQTPIQSNVAPLRNVMALSALIDRVQNRHADLPGMACFHGPSGYGKTTAAVWNANSTNAHQVQVKSVWTRKYLCTMIAHELGLDPAKTIPALVDQISEELSRTGRPLIIDEADHLVKNTLIELVRDIYESSGATIILIGEEQLPQKLAKWERVHGRMLDWVAAQPADLREVGLLAGIYCRGIELDDQLRQMILKASNASVRRICVNLNMIAEMARTKGLDRVTGADWGKAEFFTGSAPAPRRFA